VAKWPAALPRREPSSGQGTRLARSAIPAGWLENVGSTRRSHKSWRGTARSCGSRLGEVLHDYKTWRDPEPGGFVCLPMLRPECSRSEVPQMASPAANPSAVIAVPAPAAGVPAPAPETTAGDSTLTAAAGADMCWGRTRCNRAAALQSAARSQSIASGIRSSEVSPRRDTRAASSLSFKRQPGFQASTPASFVG